MSDKTEAEVIEVDVGHGQGQAGAPRQGHVLAENRRDRTAVCAAL
jgi:hypothetical protein